MGRDFTGSDHPPRKHRGYTASQVVIPAKAGIHERLLLQQHCLDSRLRGNDEIMDLCA